jgi:hypothetical protein
MADEWHYSIGGAKNGPVTAVALKGLADSGMLSPAALVWKEGMAQWVPARAVKGLFPAAALTPPAAATVPPAPQPGSQRAETASADVWHPIQAGVDMARDACPEDLAEQISSLATKVGLLTLYGSAAIAFLGGLLFAIRGNNFRIVLAAIAAAVAILVGQYVASRLLGAIRAAISSNRSILSSLAVPDSLFVVIVVATVAGVTGLLWAAIELRELMFLIGAVVALVVGAYSALVVITPASLGVDIEPECRAAQEAVGVFTFVFKVILRSAPLLFTAGIIFTTYRLLEATVRIMTADGLGLMRAYSEATTGLAGLFAAIAIPIYVYLLLLVYYITLDVISAIVSLPGKLDLIAERMSESERP